MGLGRGSTDHQVLNRLIPRGSHKRAARVYVRQVSTVLTSRVRIGYRKHTQAKVTLSHFIRSSTISLIPLSNCTIALGGMGATSATSRWKPSCSEMTSPFMPGVTTAGWPSTSIASSCQMMKSPTWRLRISFCQGSMPDHRRCCRWLPLTPSPR